MISIHDFLTADHGWRLVALAGCLSILAGGVAIAFFNRARTTSSSAQLTWLGIAAGATGCCISAAHYVATLAGLPTVGQGNNAAAIIVTLFITVTIVGAGLGLALLDMGRWTPALGGAGVGGGIASIHYADIIVLEWSGRIPGTTFVILASVGLCAALVALALTIATRGDGRINRWIATILFSIAVLFTCFNGLDAAFIFDPMHNANTGSLSPFYIYFVAASAAATMLCIFFLVAMNDRQWKGDWQRQKFLFDVALNNMSQGLCMLGPDGRVMLFNENYANMTGLPSAAIKDSFMLDLLKQRKASGNLVEDPDRYYARVIAQMREGKSLSRMVEIASGRTLRVLESPVEGGGWIATFEDITDWLAAQAKISYMAHHDALTGLANRTQLVEKMETAFATIEQRGGSVAVHFVDLDRFKQVNDTLGHDGGDFLLQTVAERLRSVTRTDDMVARLGGDEFVVIQTGVKDKNQAEEFARRLTTAVTAPIKLKEQSIIATVSVGVAVGPADGANPERLLKSADLALYKAKKDGRNCTRFFLVEMDTELQSRFKLEQTIRDAVLHDRFELHYQPLFEMSERRLIGFEALIRLQAEDGILIPPLEFIPVAEEMGLIDKIGAWVLREACRTAATWPENLTVAVNLSPTQFATGSISDIVADALKEAGLAANRLELEITETVLLGNSEAIMAELQKLKAMGVAIVMDDFGTGYSSLGYLWRFPFDKIKIDRSFMQGFEGSGRDAKTVVKTIIALGRELNMRVTVEGVETATQAAFLDNADGDQAQGFFFGHPVPASEIAANILVDFKKHGALSSFSQKEELPLVKSR